MQTSTNITRASHLCERDRRGNLLRRFPNPLYTHPHSRNTKRTFRENGIDVTIEGSLIDVTSVINTLETYKPIKMNPELLYPVTVSGPSSAHPPSCASHLATGVPTRGTEITNGRLYVLDGGKKYSGSGVVIVNFHRAYNPIFILFNSAPDGTYKLASGKLDKNLEDEILYANAKEELKKASYDLFSLDAFSLNTVDVEQGIGHLYYKYYVYSTLIPDTDKLVNDYINNVIIHPRRDVDPQIGLFYQRELLKVINDLGSRLNIVASTACKKMDGTTANVSGDTLRCIQNILGDPGLHTAIVEGAVAPNTSSVGGKTIYTLKI